MLIRQRKLYSYYCDVHYCVIICRDHCLVIGYDDSRRDEKMNMFILRRSRIEVESQSNRNCNSRLSCKLITVEPVYEKIFCMSVVLQKCVEKLANVTRHVT